MVYRPHTVLLDGRIIYAREDNRQSLVNGTDGLWTLSLQEGGIVSFNTKGMITHIVDRHGIATQFIYEDEHLTAIEHNHHSVIRLVWVNNRLSKAVGPSGEVIAYAYGEASLEQVFANRHHITYDYDKDRRLNRIDANQRTIFEGTYDDYNRLCHVTSPSPKDEGF